MTRYLATLLIIGAVVLTPANGQSNGGGSGGTTSTATAHAFNGTMTITNPDGTTSTGSFALSGNETLTHGSNGQLLSGEFTFTATINGCTFTGTSRARIGSGRYYSGKHTFDNGKRVKFSVLIGHPEGYAGSVTMSHLVGDDFTYGTGSFNGKP